MSKLIQVEGKALNKAAYFQQTGYTPHQGQRIIHASNARFRVLCNGRRWGKTFMGAKEAETLAFVKNRLGQPMTGWIVGPNYTDCEKEFRIVYDTFKSLGIDTLSSKFLNNVDSGNLHIKTNWGFDLQCRSASHPESLVGEGLDFVLLVEAGRHKKKTWTEYIRPALSDKRGTALFSGVPEGSSATSLLYDAWKRGQHPEKTAWASWRMPSWTNDIIFPGGRQDPEIVDAADDLTDEEFRRQYGAEFVEKAGRVMKEWDDDVHIRHLEYNPNWPLYAAVDYGFTNDWVWLWIQVDNFENVYVIGEIRRQFMDSEEIARQVIAPHPLTKHLVCFYPDPHEPDDTQILARHIRKPYRSNTGGEIRTRNAIIRNKLKVRPEHGPVEQRQAQILFDFSCKQLIWEMSEGYRWPENRSDIKNDSENPLDKDNHGPEALSRFMYGYFGKIGEKGSRQQRTAKVGRGR